MVVQVRRLEPEDERSSFRSGNVELDRFFHLYAGQNQFRHHLGTTYVALDGAIIVGFATVTPSVIAPETMPVTKSKRRARYPLPVLRLARLATDERARGAGIGLLLLRAVFGLAQKMASDYGCVGVVVDAKAGAVSFYAKLGFVRLDALAGQLGDRPEPVPMFLELGQLAP